MLLLLTAGLAISKERVRDWQVGKVLNSKRSDEYAATVPRSGTNGEYGNYPDQTTSRHRPVYNVYQTFVIGTDKCTYVAQQRLRWRWSKPADVTVNGPVRFAADKRKLFLIDDDGKKYEMEIVKRILKKSAASGSKAADQQSTGSK